MAAAETAELRNGHARKDGAAALDPDAADRLRAVIGKLSRRLRPTVAGSALTPSQISVLFTIVRRAILAGVSVAKLCRLSRRHRAQPQLVAC